MNASCYHRVGELDKEFYSVNTNRVLVTGGSGFIGTHLIELLSKSENQLLNVDISAPKLRLHDQYWSQCDIKDYEGLLRIFDEFKPTHVINLAAKASLDGDSIDDFPDNVIGTKNMVECVNQMPQMTRFIHVSTQYVVTPGVYPKSDEFLRPYTAYGESKAEGERIVRKHCSKAWVILRPTNIWGPMHPNFSNEMWPYLQKRYYFHPGFAPIRKHYGYVENAVDQIVKFGLVSKDEDVCGKVFYITDPPIDSAEWLNGFSLVLSGKPIRRIPKTVWRLLARFGDVLLAMGIRSPISSERFFRLTVNEALPFEKTIALTGEPEISLHEGITRSVAWFKSVSNGQNHGDE